MFKTIVAAIIAAFCFFSTAFAEEQSVRSFMVQYIMDHKDFKLDESIEGMYNSGRNAGNSKYIEYVVDLNIQAGKEFDVDPLLLIMIEDPESGYRVWCKGDGNKAYNLTQIRREWHKPRMYTFNDKGELVKGKLADEVVYNDQPVILIWDNDLDMLRYTAWKIRSIMDWGHTCYRALQPWSTRKGVWANYQKISLEIYGHKGNGSIPDEFYE